MRVLDQTDDRLILEDKPLFLGLVLVFFLLSCVAWMISALSGRDYGMALLAVAVSLGIAAIFALAVERVWLILDRKDGTIEFRRRNARGFRSEIFPLAELDHDGILVESSDDTHRIALRIASRPRPVPMTRYYQSGAHIRRCAEIARAWLLGGR